MDLRSQSVNLYKEQNKEQNKEMTDFSSRNNPGEKSVFVDFYRKISYNEPIKVQKGLVS